MPKNRISKLKDGRWSYSVTDSQGNRLNIKSKQQESYREFKDRCDELDIKAEQDGADMTLDDLFSFWMTEHVEVNLSPSSVRNLPGLYKGHIMPYLGSLDVRDITRADVYKVLSRANKAGLSEQTIRHIRGCISRPFNWAINTLGLRLNNPTQGLVFKAKSNNQVKRRRYIPQEDYAKILDAAQDSKYYNFLQVLYLTGLRPSEALGLRLTDIYPDRLEIRRGWTLDGQSDLKNKSAVRDWPMYDELAKILRKQKASLSILTKEGWLFPSESGQPSMDGAMSALKRILRQTAVHELGGRNGQKKLALIEPALHYTLYDFRHTFATRMAEQGIQPVVLQRLMGHKKITTTMQFYVDVTDKMWDEAIDILNIV